MTWPTSILALLVGIAGWYYMFYSRAAHRLVPLEGEPLNERRVLLRRTNGLLLIILAALLYFGAHGIDSSRQPGLFAIVWLSVLFLLLIVVILALIDIRLTVNLRRKKRRKTPQ